MDPVRNPYSPVGAFSKLPDQLYRVRGYTPVTPGSDSGYTTEVSYMT